MRLAISLALVLASCGGSTTDTDEAAEQQTATGHPKATSARLLQQSEALHLFSNRQQPDQFRVQLIGPTVLAATVRLSIVTAANDTIWTDSFPATALITEEETLPTAAAQEKYIARRINGFFQEQHFAAQAIADDADFDSEANGNRLLWQEVKQERQPGFNYTIGDEMGHLLSVPASLGKAIIIDSCC